ncbi:hypothetical protein FBZ87_101794 [Nitrospirillum amazonense]|uniref:Uncharacterized protein n=1 Tax=Nitrospirillum amazonense TaxID=28077 RepID=A0A560KR32_9PROT|nr:hypothetical protein FBZ87_101794 [Nitrospirillum amazonense]
MRRLAERTPALGRLSEDGSLALRWAGFGIVVRCLNRNLDRRLFRFEYLSDGS